MERDAHRADVDGQHNGSIPVPTTGRVLTRSLWAAGVLVAGLPLLAWWVLDNDSPKWASWALLGGALVLAPAVQRLARPPRPPLDKDADRGPLERALAIASDCGRLPEDPAQRWAAGALACQYIEETLLFAAAAVGAILTALGNPRPAWIVAAAALTLYAATNLVWARRGWRYLAALHTSTPPA